MYSGESIVISWRSSLPLNMQMQIESIIYGRTVEYQRIMRTKTHNNKTKMRLKLFSPAEHSDDAPEAAEHFYFYLLARKSSKCTSFPTEHDWPASRHFCLLQIVNVLWSNNKSPPNKGIATKKARVNIKYLSWFNMPIFITAKQHRKIIIKIISFAFWMAMHVESVL